MFLMHARICAESIIRELLALVYLTFGFRYLFRYKGGRLNTYPEFPGAAKINFAYGSLKFLRNFRGKIQDLQRSF